MIDITPLTFLPQEQLILASTHETREIHRYRRLEQTFSSLSPAIGRLMEVLGQECEQRIESLREVAQRLGLGACVTTAETGGETSSLVDDRRQAAVSEDTMEDQVLREALSDAHHSRSFFHHLLKTNSTPEFETLLLAFVRQKKAACDTLEKWQQSGRDSVSLRSRSG